MTPEARAIKNAKQRERYATDPEYRERMLAIQRERTSTPEGKAKRLARKKRWQAANREKYLEQSRRQGVKRRARPEVRADAARRTREWREQNPERFLDLRYAKFGLTYADYCRLLNEQNGVCAICGQPETSREHGKEVRALAVDHCHENGHVRGLLCQRCNHTLGRMNDDPSLLRRAADYLEATCLPH